MIIISIHNLVHKLRQLDVMQQNSGTMPFFIIICSVKPLLLFYIVPIHVRSRKKILVSFLMHACMHGLLITRTFQKLKPFASGRFIMLLFWSSVWLNQALLASYLPHLCLSSHMPYWPRDLPHLSLSIFTVISLLYNFFLLKKSITIKKKRSCWNCMFSCLW